MLTDVLLITLLVVLISGIVYIRHLIKFHFKSYTNIKNVETNNIHSSMAIIKQMILNNHTSLEIIATKYSNRLEEQEKLIAELKKTQAPEAVVETIDIVNEWLNGEQGV